MNGKLIILGLIFLIIVMETTKNSVRIFGATLTILFILFIMCLYRFDKKYKILFMLGILIVTHRTLLLSWYFVSGFSMAYSKFESLPDDSFLQKYVRNVFTDIFTFKHNFWKLPKYPSIIVSNYMHDRLENIACIIIPKNLCIIMGQNLTILQKIVKNVIIKHKNTSEYKTIEKKVKNNIEKGISVFAYVGVYTNDDKRCNKVRTGMFRIAQTLGIPITPLAIDYIYNNGGIVPPQKFHMHVGDTFNVTDVEQDVKRTRKFFTEKLQYFYSNKFS